MSGGAVLARVVSLLTVPLIARLFEPAAVGALSMAIAMATLATPALSLSYYLAMPLPRRHETAGLLALLSLLSATAGTLAILAAASAWTSLAGWSFPEVGLSYVYLGTGLAWLSVVLETMIMWATRIRSYGIIASTQIAKAIVGEGSKVGVGLAGAGAVGLVLGHVAGFLASIAMLIIPLKALLAQVRLPTGRRLWAVARRYREYPLARVAAQLLSAYGVQSPVLWIGFQYDAYTAGQFGMALMIISLPVNLLGLSISRSLFAEVAAMRNARAGADAIQGVVRRLTAFTCLISIPVALLIATLSKPAFALLLGNQWVLAGDICSILALYTALQFISYPLLTIFNFSGGQRQLLTIHLQRAFLVSSVFVICHVAGYSFYVMLWLFSSALSFHYLIVMVRAWRRLRQWEV